MEQNNTKTYLILITLITVAILGYLFLKSPTTKSTSPKTTSSTPSGAVQKPTNFASTFEKGQTVALENGEVKIDASAFTDTTARFFNVRMSSGKTVYFFVVKDQFGTFRAAANACQVCFGVRKGFHQEGNEIVCNNCFNRYPLEKIATEKGGCNPGPINPNLQIINGNFVITQSQLEEVSQFF